MPGNRQTRKSVQNFIRHEAFPRALQRMQGISWVQEDPETRTVTIGQGLEKPEMISIGRDGSIQRFSEKEDRREIPLFQRSWDNRNPFANAHLKIYEKAKDLLREELAAGLGRETARHWSGDWTNPMPVDAAPELEKAAYAMTAIIAGRFINCPAAYGAGILRRVLGTDRVREALDAVGKTATLEDVQWIGDNREAVLEARRWNPNAVVMLLAHQDDSIPGWENPIDWDRPGEADRRRRLTDISSPGTIMEQARQKFQQAAEQQRRLGMIPQETEERDLWEQFTSLDQAAVRSLEPEPEQWATLASMQLHAGVPMTYSAIITLSSRFHRSLRTATHNVVTLAYIQESHRRKTGRKGTERKGTQKELREDLFHIRYSALSASRRCCPLHRQYREEMYDALNGALPDCIPEWEELTRSLPRVKHDRDRATPAWRRKGPNPNNARAPDLIREIIRTEAGPEALRTQGQVLSLELVPGTRVALRTRGSRKPLIEMTREPSGFLRERHHHTWALPGELPDSRQSPEEIRGWTTQGAWARTITGSAREHIAPGPPVEGTLRQDQAPHHDGPRRHPPVPEGGGQP